MTSQKKKKQPHDRIRWRFFFPVQLLVLHIKKNHFLLLLWALLFGFATQFLANKFGVPQQFLVPEYQGSISFISFGIVGFALGGFITGFNLYTYIMHGYRFPFIATLSHPFQKFSLNNFVIPGLFILVFSYQSYRFQVESELIEPLKALLNIGALIIGVTMFQSLSYAYFMMTNKNASAFGEGKARTHNESAPVDSPIHARSRWSRMRHRTAKWRVDSYMSKINKFSRARDSFHYEQSILEKVFSQNHINAARFEIVLVISFIVIGSFSRNSFFIIPAAASSLLFFTMMLMLLSALHSWIKGWTLTLFALIFVALNFFYTDVKWISIESRAIGLNYEKGSVKYEPHLYQMSKDTIQKDINHTLSILNNWKKNTGEIKPKLVLIDCSGGGTRSAYWTMRSLTFADSICGGKLFPHTVMFTGASGGMFGAAYLRELIYQSKKNGLNLQDSIYSERMAKDLLNPVILSLATNDWFFRFSKIEDRGLEYSIDRATTFEEYFNQNTDHILDKRLEDYYQPEYNAEVPMMILSPTIVNDGRRLMMSAQPISYLTSKSTLHAIPEDVEYMRLFRKNEPGKIKWVTALRMNATFPYIFPMTTLPSEPALEIMDAGLRDNFGIKTTAQFLHVFEEWIANNTSGVILVQVRDLPKYLDLSNKENSLFGKFTAPLGTIYGNMTKTQDYNNDQILEYLRTGYRTQITMINFELQQTEQSQISLSWHLTQSEKRHIRGALKDNYFLYELENLRRLLK